VVRSKLGCEWLYYINERWEEVEQVHAAQNKTPAERNPGAHIDLGDLIKSCKSIPYNKATDGATCERVKQKDKKGEEAEKTSCSSFLWIGGCVAGCREGDESP